MRSCDEIMMREEQFESMRGLMLKTCLSTSLIGMMTTVMMIVTTTGNAAVVTYMR
jgi:hypothetical protein